MKIEPYLKKILIIILLTNIPMLITLPFFYRKSLGWMLGSLGSGVNLIWLSYHVRSSLNGIYGKAKIKALKGYYLRFLVLVVYAVIVVKFIKPDILIFGFGLISGQIAIYIHEISSRIKANKYYKED